MPSSVLTVYLFLSTPSARRATRSAGRVRRSRSISIHALREEGDAAATAAAFAAMISIHALREEGDPAETGPRNFR